MQPTLIYSCHSLDTKALDYVGDFSNLLHVSGFRSDIIFLDEWHESVIELDGYSLLKRSFLSNLSDDPMVKSAQAFIIEYYFESGWVDKLSIEMSAYNTNCHRRTLQGRFAKTSFGCPKTYENYVRENLAKYFLVETEMSIVSITRELGYDNPPTFSSSFRKWTGLSPTAYRESYSNCLNTLL